MSGYVKSRKPMPELDVTVTTTVALAGALLESVTVAAIVCVPGLSTRVNDGPVPSGPSMLEVHWIAADRSPSPGSTACPVKATPCPNETCVPFWGSAMVNTGSSGPRSSTRRAGLPLAASRLW